jgi:2-methylcitrate dehydratase PrpD
MLELEICFMAEASIAEQFGAFIETFDYPDLSEIQVQKIKWYFLDWLASAIAGKNEKPVRIILDLIGQMGGAPEATVIADNTPNTALWAALANGAASHAVEMDDLHRESIFHPAAAIIPAVFAAAERRQASGRELITAIAAGYEIGIRVALAAGTGHYRHWHTTATCGTFGATAGAAKIMGLNQVQIAAALGSAGTQAAGLWEFLVENTMSKQLHTAKAAFNGLLSALLAAGGFTGAKRILEGEKGFFKATAEGFQAARCLEGLGAIFHFERNSLKQHASCGHTHSAIDAVLEATRGRRLQPNEVKTVNVRVYQGALDLLGEVDPSSPYLAKFCLPYCIATAIRFGQADLADFTNDRLQNDDLAKLMTRIHIESDPALDALYPRKWPARVEIVTTDDTRLAGAVDVPKGDPENFPTDTEIIDKFKNLTKALISSDAANKIVSAVVRLEDVKDVCKILNAI